MQIHISEPYFSQIRDGTKTVEGRLIKGKFVEMDVGDELLIVSENTVLIPIFHWILEWINITLAKRIASLKSNVSADKGGINNDSADKGGVSADKGGINNDTISLNSRAEMSKSIFNPKNSSIMYVKMVLSLIYPATSAPQSSTGCIDDDAELFNLDLGMFACERCRLQGINSCNCNFIQQQVLLLARNSVASLFKLVPHWKIMELAQK